MTLQIDRLRVDMRGNLSNDLSDAGEAGGSVGVAIEFDASAALTDGAAANQADAYWSSRGRTLASGNDETIDLFDFGSLDIGAGAGLDPVGQAITLESVVALIVRNNSSSTGTLTVGAEGTGAAWNSPFAGDDEAALTLPPGATACLVSPGATGWAVADSTNHLLKIAASGGAVNYDIIVIGRQPSA